MNSHDTQSRCSLGQPLKFRWYGEKPAAIGRDLEEMLRSFESELTRSNRIINDFVLAAARAEIKRVVEKAILGKLRPVKQIKVVDGKRIPTLFEIRWQNIPMREIQSNGELKTVNLLFRMYHSEPEEAPGYFVGHHIHEKDVSVQCDIKSRQNQEIALARHYFESGKESRWGIRELTQE